MTQNNLEQIITFVRSIGINVTFKELKEDTFLPGLLIEQGSIYIDPQNLKYPGDVLHEAGHIAIVPEADRATLSGTELGQRKDSAAEEMMAIAWSYAACVHLNLDPYFVFHESGYKGSGNEIADQFIAGQYIGVPMLQWTGMAAYHDDKEHQGFPAMKKWMRDV
jgi:hypothetical protein